ncbi:MAG TPA: EamA family transporter, partial [Spirochaetia bacterium]|nr:EamA family transporter [Spirochaetia bacterium]
WTWVLAIRWTIGGILLLGLSTVRGRLASARPSLREIGASAALGVLLILVGNGGITIMEKNIDSYIAALLASCVPVVVALFDAILLGKRLTLARVLGIVLGLGGVALLLYDGRSVATTFSPALLLGCAGVLGWSLATSLGHRAPVHGDNTVNSGIQMLFVGALTLVISLLFGPRPAQVLSGVAPASIFGVLYLGFIGSLAFSAYTYLMVNEPAERVVSYALVNPLIALLIGLGFGGESPTPLLAAGLPLVLAGVAFMFYGERSIAWLRSSLSRRR